ncbi:hypothetical protein CR513_35618, partial [Mucuna pruriens]
MASRCLKICLGVSLLFLIIVAVVIATLILTVFKPKNPNITVHPVGLEHFDFSILSNLTANISIGMTITIENPNYGSFEYTNNTGYVKFHDNVVAQIPIGAELVPARSQINEATYANLMVPKLINDPNFFPDLLLGTLNFTSTASLPGKALLLNIIKLKTIIYSTCHISLNILSKIYFPKSSNSQKPETMASRGFKICLAVCLLFLIIVTIVIVTLFLTIFKPKNPNITVHPLGLEQLDFSLLPNLTINVSLGMLITIENPNYGSFEYTNSTSYVNFHDTVVAEVPIGAELVPARSQINVTTSADFMVAKLINDPNFWSDVLLGTLNFTSTTALSGKARMLKIIKLKATAYSSCDISKIV